MDMFVSNGVKTTTQCENMNNLDMKVEILFNMFTVIYRSYLSTMKRLFMWL
jgi:hypothetical protein